MSKARDEYLKWCEKMIFADAFPPVKYIKELEKSNAELIELVKRICIANGINSEHVLEDFYEKLKSQKLN